MLPRIIVWDLNEREALMAYLGVNQDQLLVAEAQEMKVDDFRHWVNNTISILYGKPKLVALVWGADLLSVECQSVLLKPLEELSSESQMVLVVSNENGLMSTILSRCTIDKVAVPKKSKEQEDAKWEMVLAAWKKGPGECLKLAESCDLEGAKDMVDLVISRMSGSFQKNVSEKRSEVADLALGCAFDLRQKNINFKLALGDFFLRSWMHISS